MRQYICVLDVNNIGYSNVHLYQYNKSYDKLQVNICYVSVISNIPGKIYPPNRIREEQRKR